MHRRPGYETILLFAVACACGSGDVEAPTPLWIDEYGFGFQVPGSSGAWTDGYTEQDQEQAVSGFLAATTCWTSTVYNKVAWIGGNDAPYDGHTELGLFSTFSGATPIPRPAWSDVALYYGISACP